MRPIPASVRLHVAAVGAGVVSVATRLRDQLARHSTHIATTPRRRLISCERRRRQWRNDLRSCEPHQGRDGMPLPNWEGRRPHPVITKVDSVSPCGERSYERQTSCTTHVSTPFPGPACAHSQSTGHTQRYWSAPKSGTTPPPRNTPPLEQGTVWGVNRSAPRRYLDLSQAELANTARCSVNTVRKLEAECVVGNAW